LFSLPAILIHSYEDQMKAGSNGSELAAPGEAQKKNRSALGLAALSRFLSN